MVPLSRERSRANVLYEFHAIFDSVLFFDVIPNYKLIYIF